MRASIFFLIPLACSSGVENLESVPADSGVPPFDGGEKTAPDAMSQADKNSHPRPERDASTPPEKEPGEPPDASATEELEPMPEVTLLLPITIDASSPDASTDELGANDASAAVTTPPLPTPFQVEPSSPPPVLDAGTEAGSTEPAPTLPTGLLEHQSTLEAGGYAPCDSLTDAVGHCCERGSAFYCTSDRCECIGTPFGYGTIRSLCTIAPATPLTWECP